MDGCALSPAFQEFIAGFFESGGDGQMSDLFALTADAQDVSKGDKPVQEEGGCDRIEGQVELGKGCLSACKV